jgi:Ger(x)C family germination protein
MKQIAIKKLLILLTILPLAGCWDTNEPERLVYAHGLGIDYKDGEYRIYLQIINLSLLAKAEVSSGGAEVKVELGNAKGKTVDEAVNNLYHSSQRVIFWGHLSFLVFTEEALKHGAIKGTIDLLDRYRETRYRIWVFTTNDPLSKLLISIPILDMSTVLSRLSDPKASFAQSSIIRPIDMRELLISLNEPGHEAVLPFLTIVKDQWTTEKGPHNAIKSNGLAVVTKNKLNGILTIPHSKGFRWISKEFVRDQLSVNSKQYSIIDLLIEKKKIKVEPVISDGNISFTIKVKAKAILDQVNLYINRQIVSSEVEEVIKKEIMKTYLEGLAIDSDIYRLSEVLYRKNVHIWKKVEHNGKIPLTKESIRKISVSVNIVNGSKQRQEPTLE